MGQDGMGCGPRMCPGTHICRRNSRAQAACPRPQLGGASRVGGQGHTGQDNRSGPGRGSRRACWCWSGPAGVTEQPALLDKPPRGSRCSTAGRTSWGPSGAARASPLVLSRRVTVAVPALDQRTSSRKPGAQLAAILCEEDAAAAGGGRRRKDRSTCPPGPGSGVSLRTEPWPTCRGPGGAGTRTRRPIVGGKVPQEERPHAGGRRGATRPPAPEPGSAPGRGDAGLPRPRTEGDEESVLSHSEDSLPRARSRPGAVRREPRQTPWGTRAPGPRRTRCCGRGPPGPALSLSSCPGGRLWEGRPPGGAGPGGGPAGLALLPRPPPPGWGAAHLPPPGQPDCSQQGRDAVGGSSPDSPGVASDAPRAPYAQGAPGRRAGGGRHTGPVPVPTCTQSPGTLTDPRPQPGGPTPDTPPN